jgi:hypothetical protein
MKHTKGPWRVQKGKSVEGEYSIESWDGNIATISLMEDEPEGIEEANAHLIAAAPELLEACKLAYEKLDNITAYHQVIFEKIHSAINKAEGDI